MPTDEEKAIQWAEYLSPKCGEYRFAHAMYQRHYPCIKSKREEYARKGSLPGQCVSSWKDCATYRADIKAKCEEERKTFAIDTAQYIASGRSMPHPVPTYNKDGWVYPKSWEVYRTAPGSTARPGGAGGAEGRLDPSITNVEGTSMRKVTIGLGIGVGLLLLGLWLSSGKKK